MHPEGVGVYRAADDGERRAADRFRAHVKVRRPCGRPRRLDGVWAILRAGRLILQEDAVARHQRHAVNHLGISKGRRQRSVRRGRRNDSLACRCAQEEVAQILQRGFARAAGVEIHLSRIGQYRNGHG